jgi:hypothetical protein
MWVRAEVSGQAPATNKRVLALSADQVLGVLTLDWVTPIPTAPAPLVGLTALGGRIVPVFDLATTPRALPPGVAALLGHADERDELVVIVDKVSTHDEKPEGAEVIDLAELANAVRKAIAGLPR